ncbi:MAG: hypothetical protein PHX60_06805 [Giesbergeria sp.]|uniref:hypothetical protein n=1 Tax=Giesbergeria sp. TaxID=2818473 RepID=UPI002616B1EC|nr:hypothetical protein [Giesbergeria sp.]MDD2609394.1 hypothetical protein [Giesbergeria sp.]
MIAAIGFLLATLGAFALVIYSFVKTAIKLTAAFSAFVIIDFSEVRVSGIYFLILFVLASLLINHLLNKIIFHGLFDKNKTPALCFVYGILLCFIISFPLSMMVIEVGRYFVKIDGSFDNFYWPTLYISVPISIFYTFISLKSMDKEAE